MVLVPVSTLLKYRKLCLCLDEHVVSVFSILILEKSNFSSCVPILKILLAVSSVAVAVGVVSDDGKYCCSILKNVPD